MLLYAIEHRPVVCRCHSAKAGWSRTDRAAIAREPNKIDRYSMVRTTLADPLQTRPAKAIWRATVNIQPRRWNRLALKRKCIPRSGATQKIRLQSIDRVTVALDRLHGWVHGTCILGSSLGFRNPHFCAAALVPPSINDNRAIIHCRPSVPRGRNVDHWPLGVVGQRWHNGRLIMLHLGTNALFDDTQKMASWLVKRSQACIGAAFSLAASDFPRSPHMPYAPRILHLTQNTVQDAFIKRLVFAAPKGAAAGAPGRGQAPCDVTTVLPSLDPEAKG